MRCEVCNKDIVLDTKYQNWLLIMNFFEFLFHEEYINESTYELMVDRLMTFKQFAFDKEECL